MADGSVIEKAVFSDFEVERGRLLFAKECRFVLGARKDSHLQSWGGIPEIAFAGRSNVGKSSLVNGLTGRKTLARTSNTPGRTQQLNFFNLGGSLVLVDLPGYGYAKASRSDIEKWTKLTRNYLRGRQELLRVYLLIDSRHSTKDLDRQIMDELDITAVSYQVILTKIDKIKKTDLERLHQSLCAELSRRPAAHPDVHTTSSLKNEGICSLRASIAQMASQRGHSI